MGKTCFVNTHRKYPKGTSKQEVKSNFDGLDPFALGDVGWFDQIWSAKKIKLVAKVGKRKVLIRARIESGNVPCPCGCERVDVRAFVRTIF